MIHNKFRYILTLVALFAMTAGAWAQATFGVKEITADMVPADWNGDNTIVSPEDLATLGITFFGVTKAQASAWADYPTEGTVRLLYAYSSGFSSVDWYNGTPDGDSWNFKRNQIYVANATGYRYFVTVPPAAPAGPEVTWDATAKQASFTMPANDVEMEVEYYDPILTLAANNSEWGKFEVTYAGEIDDSKLTLIEATKGLYGDIPENLFDGKTDTKWCCETFDGCYIEFYTENAIEVVGYILTTANDNEDWAGRNPKNWVLKGKLNENGEWETIATVSNDTKMEDVNFTPYQFDVDKPGTYKYFRLEIKETTGDNVLQLSEFTLLKKSSLPDITFNEGKYSIIPGAEVTIKAIPAEGYHFDAWSNNEEGYEVGKLRLIIDEDKEITAIFAENPHDITFAEGTPEADKWKAEPNTDVKKGQTVTVSYSGTKKVLGVKAEKKVAAPATVLSGALVDGAIIKVNFKWRDMNKGDYVQGVYNAASGTFTTTKGGNDWGKDDKAVYKVEKSGDNIIIGAGFFDYTYESMVWTFNTTNDTYTTTNGDEVNAYPEEYGLISVTLNGTDITSQLTAQ